jgi:hypothetical protein
MITFMILVAMFVVLCLLAEIAIDKFMEWISKYFIGGGKNKKNERRLFRYRLMDN